MNFNDFSGLIPARIGSKGIEKKNLKILNGKPLIDYTFDSVQKSNYIRQCFLSTDSNKIGERASNYNKIRFSYLRPSKYSSDKSTAIGVLEYHINWLKKNNIIIPKNFVYLQPTSPIRSDDLIDRAIEKYLNSGSKSLFTAVIAKMQPHELFTVEKNKLNFQKKDFVKTNRQFYQPNYFITGSIYIINTKWFLEKRRFLSEDSSILITDEIEAIDIDSEFDFEYAEWLLSQKYNFFQKE